MHHHVSRHDARDLTVEPLELVGISNPRAVPPGHPEVDHHALDVTRLPVPAPLLALQRRVQLPRAVVSVVELPRHQLPSLPQQLAVVSEGADRMERWRRPIVLGGDAAVRLPAPHSLCGCRIDLGRGAALPTGAGAPRRWPRGQSPQAPPSSSRGQRGRGLGSVPRSEWRNRQTRQLEGLVSARTWGFKSPLRHDRIGAKVLVRGRAVKRPGWLGGPLVRDLSSVSRCISRPSCLQRPAMLVTRDPRLSPRGSEHADRRLHHEVVWGRWWPILRWLPPQPGRRAQNSRAGVVHWTHAPPYDDR